jgi:hypothetical protein
MSGEVVVKILLERLKEVRSQSNWKANEKKAEKNERNLKNYEVWAHEVEIYLLCTVKESSWIVDKRGK